MKSPISPTSKLTTVLRHNVGIPYADDIYTYSDAEKVIKNFFGDTYDLVIKKRAAFAERRYKALNKIIDKYKTDTIVELASGLSTHGMYFSENPHTLYIESDLEEIIQHKKELVERILNKKRSNLLFKKINVLDISDFNFDFKGPITVINEGLLMYLSHNQIIQVGENIRDILKKDGGLWITPDIFTKDMYQDFVRILETGGTDQVMNTGSRTIDNCFDSFEEVCTIFSRLDFSIERFVQTDVIPEVQSYTNETMDGIMKRQEVWVMRLS